MQYILLCGAILSRGETEVKRPFFLLALSLFLATCGLLAYRIIWLEYPMVPAAEGQAWQLLVNVYVTNQKEESVLSLALPLEHTGNTIVEERVLSGMYTFNTLKQGPNRVGVWSGSGVTEPEEITYRAAIHSRPRRSAATQSPLLGPYPPAIGEEERKLAEEAAARWRTLAPAARFRAVASFIEGKTGRGSPEGRCVGAVAECAGEARPDGCGARPAEGCRPSGQTRCRPPADRGGADPAGEMDRGMDRPDLEQSESRNGEYLSGGTAAPPLGGGRSTGRHGRRG